MSAVTLSQMGLAEDRDFQRIIGAVRPAARQKIVNEFNTPNSRIKARGQSSFE